MADLIEKQGPGDTEEGAEDSGLFEQVAVEPSLFPPPQNLVPTFSRAEWRTSYQRHLEHRIQRNPRDLYAHVRRVMTCLAVGKIEQGFGALVDLYLVLGPQGRPLREKMLDRFEDQLSRAQYRFLCSHLVSGLSFSDALPIGTHSLLSKGISGTTQIVVSDDEPSRGRDAVMEAEARMAVSDLIGAQAVLEAALREDPGSAEICRTLLELYRRNNLHSDFFAIYAECLSRDLALPAYWEETKRHFLQSDRSPGPEAN